MPHSAVCHIVWALKCMFTVIQRTNVSTHSQHSDIHSSFVHFHQYWACSHIMQFTMTACWYFKTARSHPAFCNAFFMFHPDVQLIVLWCSQRCAGCKPLHERAEGVGLATPKRNLDIWISHKGHMTQPWWHGFQMLHILLSYKKTLVVCKLAGFQDVFQQVQSFVLSPHDSSAWTDYWFGFTVCNLTQYPHCHKPWLQSQQRARSIEKNIDNFHKSWEQTVQKRTHILFGSGILHPSHPTLFSLQLSRSIFVCILLMVQSLSVKFMMIENFITFSVNASLFWPSYLYLRLIICGFKGMPWLH